MNAPRCVWCGGLLDQGHDRRRFCGQACRRAYEEWCAARAAMRVEAVSSWRDLPAHSRRGRILAASQAGRSGGT